MPAEPVAVIPAAGLASRLGAIPCSKEVLPVAFPGGDQDGASTITACEFLIHRFRNAGARRVFVVLRQGKWDIPAYLGDGERFGVDIAYLMMRVPFGQPYTVDAAHPFVRGKTVLFGYPDILFERADAFLPLLQRKEESGADVVLGVFPADRPEKMDMVRLDGNGGVAGFVVKPRQTELTHTWLIAAWSSRFTDFLHDHLGRRLREGAVQHSTGRELFLGDVLHSALDAGLPFEAVRFEDSDYIDVGTPDDLSRAVTRGLLSHGA
jgi:glucose-1-phosphate thymidylyltransferase